MIQRMMSLHSGLHVNPLELKPEEILIEDIAHALALENRFANQTHFPVSVAQHSWYVSRLCEREGPNVALAGLLHDGSEAYLCDVITQVKQAHGMEFYRKLEETLQALIYKKFGVVIDGHSGPIVDKYDWFMCDVEGIHAIKSWKVRPGFNLDNNEEYEIVKNWMPVGWESAKSMFLKQFHKLSKTLNSASAPRG